MTLISDIIQSTRRPDKTTPAGGGNRNPSTNYSMIHQKGGKEKRTKTKVEAAEHQALDE